ncbi:amidohydrolase [Marnyiella aurantia]|uniref:Amidohydrolase n=1 Tax=Marnyiella aurantia TaxID=2758037 RepID=A0A7D7LRA8_9FLAO|nr:M20 aminoacylase family protein [Marnyiella aurantia]MBA5246647.1 amidohydrolase [Marnyiella aurantia]QMS97998.1 amidohydrolase [Marnyiella aurantia]
MNTLEQQLSANLTQMKDWMDTMHMQPELSMAEENTSRYILDVLKTFDGFEISENVGKYGIVASLKVGDSSKSIGLRADFDALPIEEHNSLPYKSQVPGRAHLCGHDGHTTMLLAAGKYLSETKNFNGTVRLIFQPGEETMEGGPAMIADGLFEKYPVDAVFGMHNMPGLETGTFHFAEGEFMAAVDNWEIILEGKGGHGSMPEKAIDPVVAGSALVMALQTIVSRNVNPWNQAVVTIGAFNSGTVGNVIPQTASLKICIRTMTAEDRILVLDKVRSITKTQAESFGVTAQIKEGVPGAVLVNSEQETAFARDVARKYFGEDRVVYPAKPYMGSEDFAFMLQKQKGNYCMVGNGDTLMVHHPQYVFNQEILPTGAAYWVHLVEEYLK